jgi:hypothetical protein
MSQFSKALTVKQQKSIFDEALESALTIGTFKRIAGTLSPIIWDSIEKVAAEYPEAKAETVKEAQNDFEFCAERWR